MKIENVQLLFFEIRSLCTAEVARISRHQPPWWLRRITQSQGMAVLAMPLPQLRPWHQRAPAQLPTATGAVQTRPG